MAQYATSMVNVPVGISEYEINNLIPDDYKSSMPTIEEYIKNQMQEDLEYDQMSLKEYIDLFTGEPVNKA